MSTEHLATALIIGAEFVAALTDTAFRDEAKAIRSRSDIDPSSRFGMMQEQARSLQAALEAIFFDTPAFAPKARKYLSF